VNISCYSIKNEGFCIVLAEFQAAAAREIRSAVPFLTALAIHCIAFTNLDNEYNELLNERLCDMPCFANSFSA
jgi:hypothetical protein